MDHLRRLVRRFLEEASRGEAALPTLWLHIEPRIEELPEDERDALVHAANRWRLRRRGGGGPIGPNGPGARAALTLGERMV